VGELILHAVECGAKRILLGLGGTSTTDGGAGMMVALGVRFFGAQGEFLPTGYSLSDIRSIDTSCLKIADIEITCLTDSLNELYGLNGAAYVYAKQKGATDEELPLLDSGLRHYSSVTAGITGKNFSAAGGTGAAGGIGFSVISYLGGTIKPGIDEILRITGFEKLLSDADYVITGEGRFDRQSLLGKAVCGISMAAKKAGVPVILIAGSISGVTDEELRHIGIVSAHCANRNNYTDFNDIKRNAEKDLRDTAGFVLRKLIN